MYICIYFSYKDNHQTNCKSTNFFIEQSSKMQFATQTACSKVSQFDSCQPCCVDMCHMQNQINYCIKMRMMLVCCLLTCQINKR